MKPPNYETLLNRIPEELIVRRAASINGRKGENKGGARPGAGRRASMVPCHRCGAIVTKTQAIRGHGCR
jgi:ribosomal protein S26